MFKQLFASMNEMLDEVRDQYAAASGSKKKELQEKLHTLKAMSDTCIEEWLLFEEKLASFYQMQQPVPVSGIVDPELDGKRSDAFLKGQGFYKLLMYEEAIREFVAIVNKQPDFTLARIYLAMSYLHKGEMAESYSQFHFLSRLTENNQMKAISYSVMGCIQIRYRNMDKAFEYFALAYHSDPKSVEPLVDMGLCSEIKGKLYFLHHPVRN
ncbi:MAG: repeat-containing protein [Paenibacillus sp.]|jgi:tetratricopeptide (TPR) repeat protein|nr:repeat-containing protein [Paenibacillus sp.]